jgi:hypothetical protein
MNISENSIRAGGKLLCKSERIIALSAFIHRFAFGSLKYTVLPELKEVGM